MAYDTYRHVCSAVDCWLLCLIQGYPQDVTSQDPEETETVNLQDRDETEIFHFVKLSRPRRDWDVQPSRPRRYVPKNVSRPPRDRDVPKNVWRPQCRSLKTLNGEVCHLTTCFLRVKSIIFFVIYRQAWCIEWMFTRLKSRDRDRDVISSRPRRDRDVWFFQTLETETRSRRSTFKTETRRSKKRLETASRPRRSRPRLHPCKNNTARSF